MFGGDIGDIGRKLEKLKPPPIAGTPMNIAPLGILLWDNEEVPPRTTTIIDTFGYTYVTLFAEVNRPAVIILESVSQDGIKWRAVEEYLKIFDEPGRVFINLNGIVETKEVLLYRYLKIRLDAAVPVKITLEAVTKLMDLLPVLHEIRDSIRRGFGIPVETPREWLLKGKETLIEKILKEEITREEFHNELKIIEKEKVVVIEETAEVAVLKSLLAETEKIHKILTNPDTWDHDQKNVTTPGTPVQLPGLVVPDGYALVIQAKSGNEGNIYLGNSKDTAKDTSKRKTLAANDSTRLEVKKASAIWIDADNAGEGVEFWCEKRSGV